MRGKKLLAICLVLSLLVSMLPAFALPAVAATGTETDISQMDPLKALGIDTSEVPEGVDLDSNDNPYGRDTSQVNPVYELFVQELASSTLYGHNKALGKTWTEFYETQGEDKDIAIIGVFDATATVSGNFVQDASGATGQTATVAAGELSANGGLYLYFSDPVNDARSSGKELISTTSIIGNTGNQMDEDFAADPYLMQNYLRITAGDYDGDGVDEVAVYVPEQGSSRVEIYDLQLDDTFNESTAASYYLNTARWAKAWTYYFQEAPFVSNMVSLTSGDFNRDGTDDLAMTWGYYYGSDKNTPSKAVILCGAKGSMLQTAMNINLVYENSQIVRAAFTYGDIDGDNVDDLILGGQLNNDIAKGNLNSRFVAVYTYNGDNDSFIQSVAKNFDLFAKEKNDAGEEVYVYPVMQREGQYKDRFFSLPTMVANIAAVNMRGVGHAANIYIDSLIIEYGDEGLDITAALDNNSNFNKHINENYKCKDNDGFKFKNLPGRFYTEYGVIGADFTGNTQQSLQLMLNYSQEDYETTIEYNIPFYKNWWKALWGIVSWIGIEENHELHLTPETVMLAVQGLMTEEKEGDVVTGYSFDIQMKSTPVAFATSFCKLNSDKDTSFISYTGKHGVIYSDPEVLAVLASPPHFEDLASDELSGSYMESATSYSSTTGEGSEDTTSTTLSIGAYISYQHDFEVLGKKFGGMETELSYSHGWTWETSEAEMTEMTVSYETVVGQDSVVFYSIPMEYYVFDSYVPIINETTGETTGYDVQKMSVNLPHTAAVVVLPLDKYERIAADYDELPQISGTALTHTIGKPSTYPTSSAGYTNALEYDGEWAGLDYSSTGASITQEIAITEEDGDGFTHTNTVDFQIGAGPFDWIFGVTAGYENGSGKVTITSEGSTYAGTIYNMPAEAEEYGYYYAWKLFTYTYEINGNDVPVVSYLVKDVTEPPSLPQDFAQDNTLTTDTAIGLTWSYPSTSAISGFQLYRYYEFPDGNGSYELAFIPASDVSYITTEENGTIIRHYQYVDEGLADYTEYDYQLQVVRGAVPQTSILSDVLTARTKADKGYPTITLNGVKATTTNTYNDEGAVIGTITDYSLLVYPDTTSTVSVSVAESYAQAPRYQWQKLMDTGWEDLAGATKSSYKFSSSGVSAEGEYRCRLNVVYEDEDVGQVYYISAYSDPFTVEYSLRRPQLVENSFAVDTVNQTVSLSLKSAHTNHTFAPTGEVTFKINGVDYQSSYTVALGSPSGDYVTTAVLDLGDIDNNGDDFKVNLPDGVYEISAYYGGSRVFSSLTIPNSVYYVAGNGSGYLLNVNSSFTYGDDIDTKLMSVSKSGSNVEANEVTAGVTYRVFKEEPRTEVRTYEIKWLGIVIYSYRVVTTTYEKVECPDFIRDGSVFADEVGSFTLIAYKEDTEVASRDFIVNQKAITIGLTHPFQGVAGSASITHPTFNDLKVVAGGLVVGDTLENLGLMVRAYNTAGTEVTISPDTNPGLYTIVGAVSEDPGANYRNYNITYVSSTYTLTGPKYLMTIEAKPFGEENAIVGTVAIINPEVKKDDGSIINMTTTATNHSWNNNGEKLFTGGTDLTLRATPFMGYKVKSWTVTTGSASNTIETPLTTFTYQTTSNDTKITVEYELVKNKLFFQSANTSVIDGTVTVVGNAIQSGATVQPGATYTFVATPAEGYHFVEWTLSGLTNSNFLGDYDETTGTSRTTLTIADVATTILSAVFARNNYTLTLQGNLQANYLIDDGFGHMVPTTGTGIITIPGDTQVTIGPKPGYSLSDSAVWYVNGEPINPEEIIDFSYTMIITADTTIEVGTSQNNYNVSVIVDQPETTTHNRVITRVNNVVTDLTETRPVAGGSTLKFTAEPAWGYVFDGWKVNGIDSTETGKTLTIAQLAAVTEVEAVFVENEDRYTVSVAHNSGGELTYSVLYSGSGYAGNAPQDAEIGPEGITVYEGDSVLITSHPNANYMLRSWKVGDDVDESPERTLLLEDISQNLSVTAYFVPMSYTTVTYTAADGGTITSATSNGVAFASGEMIGNGTEIVITAVPDAGQMVSCWTVDDVTIKTEDNTIFVGDTLVIESLVAGATAEIKVFFAALNEHTISYELTDVTVDKSYTPATYPEKTDSTETTDYVLDGTKAVITAEPDEDHRITEFKVFADSEPEPIGHGSENGDGSWSFAINEVKEDLRIVVTAKRLYTVSEDSSLENGSITITTEMDEGLAVEGEPIIVKITPDMDYTLDGWSYNGREGDLEDFELDTSGIIFGFDMPAQDTTVSASFEAIPPVVITYSVIDINGDGVGGTNGYIYAETIRPGSGIDTDTDGSLIANRGYDDDYVIWPASQVTFIAFPDDGYMVKSWYIDGREVRGDTETRTIGVYQMTLVLDESAADSYEVEVQYDVIGDTITYSANEYGSIIDAVLTIAMEETFVEINSGDILAIDGTITFTAEAISDEYQVEGWYVNGVKQEGETELTFAYDAHAGVGAHINVLFEHVPYVLSFDGEHGTVSAEIGGSSLDDSPIEVEANAVVTFTAEADAGYAFDYWLVNGEVCATRTNPLFLTITEDTRVEAVFIEDENIVINYNVIGSGGTLSAAKDGEVFASGSLAAANDVLVFTAIPETVTEGDDHNYRVAYWKVNGKKVNSHNNTYELIVSEAATVNVAFERYDYVVTYSVVGAGNGVISAKTGSNNFASGDRVVAGKKVTFIATPASGYQVKSWQINDLPPMMTEDESYTIDRITEDTSVQVEFEEIPSYTVSIIIAGTGLGSVNAQVGEAEPEVKASSFTVSVPHHGMVALTAIRYNEYNAFKGWTVPDDPHCEVEQNRVFLSLNDVKADITIIATFVPVKMFELSASENDANGSLNLSEVLVGYLSDGKMDKYDLSSTASIRITSGMDVVIEALPNSGYMVKDWLVNGVVIDDLSQVLILKEVSLNTAIGVTFEPLLKHSLLGDGVNYTISSGTKVPDDVGTTTEIRDRGTVTFTVTPAEGYYFRELEICGVDCLSQAASPAGMTDNVVSVVDNEDRSYTVTVSNVVADITSTINAIRPVVNITEPTNGALNITYVDNGGVTHTVTSGDEVPVGTELSITATAESGYFLKDWQDDLAGKSGTKIKYIVPAKENITFSAQFAQPVVTISVPENGKIVVTYVNASGKTVILADTSTATEGASAVSLTIPVGEELTITAIANSRYYFMAWGNDVNKETEKKFTYTVPGKNTIISAQFYLRSGGGGAIIQPIQPPKPPTDPAVASKIVTNADGSSTMTTRVTTQMTVSNNAATVSLDEETEKTLLEQIKTAEAAAPSSGEYTSSVIIEATTVQEITETTVEIKASTLTSIVNETSASVAIVTNTAEVVFDQMALSAITNQATGDKVSFTVEEVDKRTLSQEVQDRIGDDAYVLDLTVTRSNSSISDFGGGTATVRIPIPQTKTGKNMKVVFIADDGTVHEVTGSTVTIGGVKYYEFTTGHFSYYALVEDSSVPTLLPYLDVSKQDWFYSSVLYAYENNLMVGLSPTTFEPNATTTRAMLVTVLWRMAGAPEPLGSNSFTDVLEGAWYIKSVTWAAENNIVKGIGDGLFAPDNRITREQMAAILCNYASYKGHDVSVSGDVSKFIDSANISAWSITSMKWAVGTGLISGKGNGILDPTGTATRAEVAAILMRFNENN